MRLPGHTAIAPTGRKPQALCRWLLAMLAAGALMVGVPAMGQGLPTGSTEASSPPAKADPLGRETPRGTVTGLLDALAAQDYARAASYFAGVGEPDAPKGRLDAAAELARKLQAALDRGGTLTPFAALSNDPAGKVDDGLAPDLEAVGTLRMGEADKPIVLQRSAAAGGTTQWRISPDTATLFAAGALPPPPAASAAAQRVDIAGAPLQDWALLIGTGVASYLAFRLLTGGVLAFLRRVMRDAENRPSYRFLHAGMPPLALYLSVLTFYLVAGRMEVAIVARQTLLRYAGIVAWIALAWFALRLVDAVARIATARMRRAERRQAVSIVTFLRRGAKFLLLAIAAVAVLDTIGLDVTTGIAALGIGGLALALGAQKTIENLVGSVAIILDKPVQVGDAAQIGDLFGTVEDIGMRSTRVRTNKRTVISIPNGQLAAQSIENFSLRDRFLFHQTIGVSYATGATGMEQALAALRTILRESEDVIDDDARVRFNGFGESALNIEIFTYFRTRSYPESLAMQEKLLFAIMRKLEDLGIEIAFPTQTLHLQSDRSPTAATRSAGST